MHKVSFTAIVDSGSQITILTQADLGKILQVDVIFARPMPKREKYVDYNIQLLIFFLENWWSRTKIWKQILHIQAKWRRRRTKWIGVSQNWHNYAHCYDPEQKKWKGLDWQPFEEVKKKYKK